MSGSTSNFVLCGQCSRHFRSAANGCPFCGAERSAARERSRPVPLPPGAARSLRYAARAALLGGAMAACSGTESGGTGGRSTCEGATNPTNGPLCRTSQDCATAGTGGFTGGPVTCTLGIPTQPCGRFVPQDCTVNADCTGGGVCQTDQCGGHSCVPACDPATCTGTNECANGLCVPKRCDAPGAAQCGDGLACSPTDPAASPSGCVVVHCTSDADCQAGYDCDPSATGRGCVHRPCKVDGDCACGYCVNGYCEPTLGYCYTIVAMPYGCVWPDEELV